MARSLSGAALLAVIGGSGWEREGDADDCPKSDPNPTLRKSTSEVSQAPQIRTLNVFLSRG